MVLLFEFVFLILGRKAGNDCEHNVGVVRIRGYLAQVKEPFLQVWMRLTRFGELESG